MTSAMRVWKPRLLIDGERQDGVEACSFHIECTRYERCDTARIRVSVRDKPTIYAFFESRSGLNRPEICLQMAQDASGGTNWQTVFHGVLDAVGQADGSSLLELECRDYMASLLDTRIASSWANQTALDIVREAVISAGLGFESDPSIANVGPYCGQFWQLEHRRLASTTQNRYQTAFDLAYSLARDHGFECHAQGKTVKLHRPYAAGEGGMRVFSPAGVTIRSFRRDLGLTGDVVVGVYSWDSRQRARSAIYYDGERYSTDAPRSGAALYTFRAPGQRMDDIRRLARGKYARIVSHALEARVTLPAIAGLGPRHFMTLREGPFAQPLTLAIDSVVHLCDPVMGYRQEVVLRDRVF